MTWKVPAWKIAHLENCTFGKLHIWKIATWENTLGKLPLGKNPLGKYLTSNKSASCIIHNGIHKTFSI